MSWITENYEKAALGVAGVVAIAVGYSIFSAEPALPQAKNIKQINETILPESKVLSDSIVRYGTSHLIVPKYVSGLEVRSFVSQKLYSFKGQEGIRTLSDDFMLHEGIPHKWWKKYNLPEYWMSDGPDRDGDKDGFTNREEFLGKTDPTNSKDHPNYIAKLKAVGSESKPFKISWTNDGKKGSGMFRFVYNKKRIMYSSFKINDVFPVESKNTPSDFKYLVGRFKILSKSQDPNKNGEKGQFFLLQDNGAGKNNKKFKLYYDTKPVYKDWKGKLKLDLDGSEEPFLLDVGEHFSLPFKKDAKRKPYQLKSANEQNLEIEYELKGVKETIHLPIQASK